MHNIKRKKVLVPLLALIAIAVTGAAVAYWTASGTGSGGATVGTDAGVTISPVSTTGTLYPAGSVPVSFTINNTSANTAVKIDKVVADTSGGNTNGISGLPVGCSAADFHFAPVTVNASIVASGTQAGSGTLSLDNTAVNQDLCKNATPTLHLKVDNSGI